MRPPRRRGRADGPSSGRLRCRQPRSSEVGDRTEPQGKCPRRPPSRHEDRGKQQGHADEQHDERRATSRAVHDRRTSQDARVHGRRDTGHGGCHRKQPAERQGSGPAPHDDRRSLRANRIPPDGRGHGALLSLSLALRRRRAASREGRLDLRLRRRRGCMRLHRRCPGLERQPAGQPPRAVSEQCQQGGQQNGSNDRGIEQDGHGQADSELLEVRHRQSAEDREDRRP